MVDDQTVGERKTASATVQRTVIGSINQSINFIDERAIATTDIVTKINTNYATIKQTQQ